MYRQGKNEKHLYEPNSFLMSLASIYDVSLTAQTREECMHIEENTSICYLLCTKPS